MEVEVEEIDVALTAVAQDDNQMDYDDEGECLCLSLPAVVVVGNIELIYPDIYVISRTTPPTQNGLSTPNGGIQIAAKKTKTKSVIHLSLRDSLPAHGPIASATFSLAKNGVSCGSISIDIGIPLLPTP